MTVTADFSELHALAVDFTRAGATVGSRASAVLRKTLFAVQADAQAMAPVDTGNLRNSISTTVTGDGRFAAMSGEVGPTVEYGVFQELGTSRMGPQPFMAPAFDRQVGPFVAAMGATATEGI